MPINVSWHSTLPETIYYDIYGIWTWEEYFAAFEEELTLARSLKGKRYEVIGNLLDASIIPRGPGISYVYSTIKRSPDNLGQVVLVTRSSFIIAALKMLLKLYPSSRDSLYITDNMEDAEHYVRSVRAALSD